MKILSSIKLEEARLAKLREIQPLGVFRQVKGFTEADEEAEVLLTYGWDIRPETLDLYPKLVWIQSLSAGVDMLPLEEIRRRNITLTNVRGAHKIQMAEYVLWVMLMLARQGVTFVKQQEVRVFSAKPKTDELFGKTVCVVGAGVIGREIAVRCRAFGMKVLGISRQGREDTSFDKTVSWQEKDPCLQESDIVVAVLPLTEATKGSIDESFIGVMKKGAWFINCARGPVVDERALLTALQEKKIAMAALDVFVQEPLPAESPFWELDNVFITPHIGGRTRQASERMWEAFYDHLRVYPDRSRLENVIDLNEGY